MAPAILERKPRILYLDAYDSFSNNIIAQVEQCVDAHVIKVHIDDPIFETQEATAAKSTEPNPEDCRLEFREFLKSFDAVIAGPGPGSATCAEDVGLMNRLWKLQEEDVLPVLGICLGFQSLCLALGASIQQLKAPRHGLISEILHNNKSIFSGIEQLDATQYHSLQVIIGHSIQTRKAVRYPGELWHATEQCPDLEPLAWDFECKNNGAVLMGVKHIKRPFWGVQFHPESICTNQEGVRLIQNWWSEVRDWNRENSRSHVGELDMVPQQVFLGRSMVDKPASTFSQNVFQDGSKPCTPYKLASLIAHGDGVVLPDLPPTTVHCSTTGSGRLTVADVCQLFGVPRSEAIVLESGLQPDLLPMGVGTGRHSIIGLVIPSETLRLHYYTGSRLMQLRDGNDQVHTEWEVNDPWSFVKEVVSQLRPITLPSTPTWAPFWGGLMGYASYEAGLETIDVSPPAGQAAHPDICFAYITRSIVFDHQLKKIYIQSIRGPDDKDWVMVTKERIYEAAGRKSQESSPNSSPLPRTNPFRRKKEDRIVAELLKSCKQSIVEEDKYCSAVKSCQEKIANGESYELCLTDTSTITATRPAACINSAEADNELSWSLYKRLASQNPAPFSAFLRLHNVHILSSSPERYISWDRKQVAQCRPIKGTVAKKMGVTAADAEAILSSSKERAENLMIVDLVRHQLHGVYGSGNVHVSQLMEVEEYETLWQLVSVIDAIPPGLNTSKSPAEWENSADSSAAKMSSKQDEDEKDSNTNYLGFDAFVHSLPPGSMTGAPKKRSCELLRSIEGPDHRRGIYSGVLGYLDVGGAGDFSVVIRTAVKVNSDPYHQQQQQQQQTQQQSKQEPQQDTWHISAGGAITAQSTPLSEYEEMLGKFSSTARAFMLSRQQRQEQAQKKQLTPPEQMLRRLLDSEWPFIPPTTITDAERTNPEDTGNDEQDQDGDVPNIALATDTMDELTAADDDERHAAFWMPPTLQRLEEIMPELRRLEQELDRLRGEEVDGRLRERWGVD